MLLMDSKNKSKPCFQISKVNSCTFVKALVENDSFELTWKGFIDSIFTTIYLWKSFFWKIVFSHTLMVQFKNSFAQTLNTCFWRYLVLSPTFQRVLGEMVFEKKCRRSWNLRNFVSIFPHVDGEGLEYVEFKAYSFFFSNPLDLFGRCILTVIIFLKKSIFKFLSFMNYS